ncbi:VOC family protein [Streptomyces sp. NBC_01166]|uniref:VOC family protein n=1 Tax=Streptomyces sp. NBC_01166 TaxID=2903755 RepID=UPI00386D126F|nr:VOC family protein [Streptomyces sp. NBC_01166]
MSASADHVVPVSGVPCWVNLMVSDLRTAQAFYAAVLGWEFRTSSLGDRFLVASADGSPVAGIGERQPGLAPATVWTPYFAVRDADLTAARIQERGATLAVGPVALGEGRAGLAADPDGATFGFWEGPALAWSPGEGKAPARLDLQTRDVFDAALFYAEVFEWPAEREIEVVYRRDHVEVDRGGQTVLSLHGGGVQTSAQAHLRPRWLVTFAVDDIERAAAAAIDAGGSKPSQAAFRTPQGFSRTLQDPDGGLFTLTHRGGDGPASATDARMGESDS